jgi:hypothetical protein
LIRSLFSTVAAAAVTGIMTLTFATSSGVSDHGPHHGPDQSTARAGVIPAGLHVHLSEVQAVAAADRCAQWASRAGFPDNGYLGGSLTTAVAIALAESGCNPHACYNDTTGQECTPAGTQGSRDSIDRGAWQINTKSWKGVTNACAYTGRCAATVAYLHVSQWGSYFSPWTTYLTDHFAGYLWAAQQAVNALGRGTLTSALIGSCAAANGAGSHVVLANCGSGTARQQWSVAGRRLRSSGGLCLTAPRGAGAVTVARCDGSRRQAWQPRAGAELYNSGDRLCLADPGASTAPGHAVTVRRCAERQAQAWFRP